MIVKENNLLIRYGLRNCASSPAQANILHISNSVADIFFKQQLVSNLARIKHTSDNNKWVMQC